MDEPPTRLIESVVIGKQGRLVIPARIREALSIREGDRVSLQVNEGELHVLSVRAGIDKARRILGVTGPPAPGEPLWSEELIAERRLEAARENEGS